MKIWKNTSTLNGYDEGLIFTEDKKLADIVLIGSKPIILEDFPNLKGIFRAGIGKDNIPEEEAAKKDISIRYPSRETIDIIYDETAAFTCSLIFRMLYSDLGTIEPWSKNDRIQLKDKSLLVIGTGNIGRRVVDYMRPFIHVITFDILENDISDLPTLISKADCITLHIPKTDENNAFMDKDKLAMMKNDAVIINTARGGLIDEFALKERLMGGHIAAGLDVFSIEPPHDQELLELPNLLVTPHIGGSSNEAILAMGKAAIDGLDNNEIPSSAIV